MLMAGYGGRDVSFILNPLVEYIYCKVVEWIPQS